MEELTTEQKLRAENFKLRVQLHNSQALVASLQNQLNDKNVLEAANKLTQEKTELEKEFGSDFLTKV